MRSLPRTHHTAWLQLAQVHKKRNKNDYHRGSFPYLVKDHFWGPTSYILSTSSYKPRRLVVTDYPLVRNRVFCGKSQQWLCEIYMYTEAGYTYFWLHEVFRQERQGTVADDIQGHIAYCRKSKNLRRSIVTPPR